MSDQLFWIIAVLLVVEILSQLFQFESLGKVFVQFYIIMVHTLVGITLASFETRELIYYFVVLIAFVNSLRFLLYKIPVIEESSLKRFILDIVVLILLLGLMTILDPLLTFTEVPVYSFTTQVAVLLSLGLTLLYEMLQRANKVGLHIDDFFPRTLFSFLISITAILFPFVLILNTLFKIDTALKYQMLAIYVGAIIIIRGFTLIRSRDPEFYDLLYVLPSLVTITLFLQLVIFGG